MAPIGEAYFPPLDRCFSGQQQLLSWETTYLALSQLDGHADNGSLKRHLNDPQTTDLLIHSFSPYPPPSAQSKSSFETKTSAINVTPSTNARYSIKQIQDDTIWLSRTTNIDEVSALRIAILEWQTRSAARLLRCAPNDKAPHLNDIPRGSERQPSSYFSRSFISTQAVAETDVSTSLDGVSRRQQRLLEIYLSERRNLLKTSEYILSDVINVLSHDYESSSSHGIQALSWYKEIGDALLSAWKLEDNPESRAKGRDNSFFCNAVEALRSKLDGLLRGSGWSGLECMQEEIEIAWASNQALEAIHIMQITVNLLGLSKAFLSSDSVLAWFRLMNECSFFEDFQLQLPGVQTSYTISFQSLAALISLAVLNISPAIELLVQSTAAGNLGPDAIRPTPYLLNGPAVNEINDILISVAPLSTASLAVLAWSVITQSLRDITSSTRETRETRQSLRAAYKYSAADSSDTDGAERSVNRGKSSLRRRSSTGSDTSQQSTLLEEIYDSITVTAVDEDPIFYLANNAVNGGKVFDVITAVAVDFCTPFGFEHYGSPGRRMRTLLLDLIRACVDFINYQPSLVTATIAVLTGSVSYWELMNRPNGNFATDPATLFDKDPLLKHKIWFSALSRFPYETLPFLQLCRALPIEHINEDGTASKTWQDLQELNCFTCKLPTDFQAYGPFREDEEGDYIQLTGNLTFQIGSNSSSLVTKKIGRNERTSSSTRFSYSASLEIASGTTGRVLSESKPFVVTWNHEYSGLSYMGKVLQCASMAGLSLSTSTSIVSADIVVEAINLITLMLSSEMRGSSAEHDIVVALESAQLILGQASDGLDRNQDIISIIQQIFENELYKSRIRAENEDSVDVLVQGLRFTHTLLPLMPDRVWPFLGRSGLLGIGQDGSQLSAIVSYEMALGRYDFLLSCTRLFDALVDDVVVHAVSRKIPLKSIARFGSANGQGAGISQHAMENVLLSFARIMIDVFESLINWRFSIQEDRIEINFYLLRTFKKILNYCFDIDDNPDISQKLTGALAPAAGYLLDVFLSTSNTDLTVQPLLHIFSEGVTTVNTTLPTQNSKYKAAQTVAALSLTTTLIQINTLLQRPTSDLEAQMFKAAPVLAKVYAAHDIYRLPVVDMLDALVRSAASSDHQPPSLLGHLGQATASYFLDALSVLDQPLENDTLAAAIWRLLSAVVSKRQQWFAIYALTGSTPRDSLRDNAESSNSNAGGAEPILHIALDSLSNVDKLEPQRALGMLEFAALAADFWPWVLTTMEQHPRFLRAISEFAARVGSLANFTSDRSYRTSSDYNSICMVSHIADILAMYTHHTSQVRNKKFARMLVPHLSYLIKNAISVPEYNASLHGNLRHNFSSRFPGCNLANFKQTGIRRTMLGELYCYNLNFATQMLAFEPSWAGRRGQGFAEEFKRANCNLSVVESQLNLFNSWKSLLVELSEPLGPDAKFQKIMAVAATDCLRANAENKLPEAIFERLCQSRADLAFTLLQRLVEVKSVEPAVKDILPTAWNTIRMQDTDLGSALDGQDADYYRMLLKILFLTLKIHVPTTNRTQGPDLGNSQSQDVSNKPRSSTSASTVQIALEILSTIVAKGFRALTMLLHTASDLISPSDFALLTALLRSCLRIPGVTRSSTHLLMAFTDTSTARCASTLLSWSDQLAASTSGDPIYGELSISFLLELSSVSSLAESLAVEGVLSHVLSTNLIRLLQSKPYSPFNQPTRMYTIWARGILPLLLNLLHAVGAQIAAEVAAALNLFPLQLSRASSAFAANSRSSSTDSTQGYITLSMATEAHTLALIIRILRTFREAGASAAVIASEVEEVKWDATQVKEDVEGWMQRRSALKDRIVATNEREEGLMRAKPLGAGGSENRLEERVVDELDGVLGVLEDRDV